ncbi:MAG: hypothetical protein RMJ87_07810 [Cytophagales bacterium]|nr:hypothetical protein [Bernardetiaceae bacterium]MDW8204917.1 hypothetical protein [Cytophagales bacterium]
MLSPAQMNALADKINAAVDLPFVNEAVEKQMIMTVVQQLGSVIGSILSSEQLAALNDPNKGINLDTSAKSGLQNDLMKKLANQLDLGMLNSALGSSIFKLISETLVSAMQKGNKL